MLIHIGGMGNNIGVWDSEYIYIDIGIYRELDIGIIRGVRYRYYTGVSREYVEPLPEVPSKAFFRKKDIIDNFRVRQKHVIYFPIECNDNLKIHNMLF